MKKARVAVIGAAAALALSFGVAATTGDVQKTLSYNDIKITLNGQEITPTDANGQYVEPFIIDGTTYLPVRGIASALGLEVGWDAATKTVQLSGGSASTPAPSQKPQPQPNYGEPTMEQKNALAKAKSYLNYTAFSRSGLISQLEYEGFSTESATYAVDNCGADWNEQAVKKAESYLKYSSFSKSGLIEQLEYEGFTHEQAVYGAEQNGY